MASEITYAEVRFKNESKSSDTNSPAAPKEKITRHQSNPDFLILLFVSLLILFLLLAISFCVAFIRKVWSCCPKNWKSFSSHCYFFSTYSKSWSKSEEDCSRMQAHLLVINTKEEQDFVIKNVHPSYAYYIGLSDPEGQNHWQWADQTPYNQSATFWHPGEPSDIKERCVLLNYRAYDISWGWNDVLCDGAQRSVCEMKIYL
ncbi:C-type lectin domain family 4 member A isoform X2 [Castor canadensis]|uniref:C-type lectin domain family 4 member A isoform X2 n=1 Tax=Castor canadensis TaxID=51338 RepID=A0AC58MS49_CASCN